MPQAPTRAPWRPAAAHRSWVSRRRLLLLLRAMRPLATFFLAGPTLMDVFSRAVVRREILLPHCAGGMVRGRLSPCPSHLSHSHTHPPVHPSEPQIRTPQLLTQWARDSHPVCPSSSEPPSDPPSGPRSYPPRGLSPAVAHLPTQRPQTPRVPGLRKAKMAQVTPAPQGQGGPEGGLGVGVLRRQGELPGGGDLGGDVRRLQSKHSLGRGEGHARPGAESEGGVGWLEEETHVEWGTEAREKWGSQEQPRGQRGDLGALRMDRGWGDLGTPGSAELWGQWGCTFSSSSMTSMCTSPRTDSPLMWVTRSPARRPASWAGLPSSTLWGCRSGWVAGSVAGPHSQGAQLGSAVRLQQAAASVSLTGRVIQRVNRGDGTGLGLAGGRTAHLLCSRWHRAAASCSPGVSVPLPIPVLGPSPNPSPPQASPPHRP